MELSLEQITHLLQSGRKLQCEAPGRNNYGQFDTLVYQISFLEGKFTVVCMAGPKRNPTEFQLWHQRHDSLEELLKEQPFDLGAFRVEN